MGPVSLQSGGGRVRDGGAGVGDWRPHAAGLAVGGRARGRRAWLASELEKARMRVPPWSLQKEHGPADTSSLTGEDLFELLTSRTVG